MGNNDFDKILRMNTEAERRQIAAQIMCFLLSCPDKYYRSTTEDNIAFHAVTYADALNQHVNPHDGELMTRWDEDMQEKADERLYDSYECALSAGTASALELIEQEKK